MDSNKVTEKKGATMYKYGKYKPFRNGYWNQFIGHHMDTEFGVKKKTAH